MELFPREENNFLSEKNVAEKIRAAIGDEEFTHYCKERKDFLDKVLRDKKVVAEILVNPHFLQELQEYEWAIDDKKSIETLVKHSHERKAIYEIMSEELRRRLETNPLATEEEISAGVYREYIEPQVRDAVFVLRGKGYNTISSGFDNLITGTQAMEFQLAEEESELSIPDNIQHALKELGIELEQKTSADTEQVSLILKPLKELTASDWKQAWDMIAKSMPDLGKKSAGSPVSSRQAFLDKQEKIKMGESVYLGFGFSNLWIENGKVIDK